MQRTERVPPDSNISETDPKKFAQLLNDRLQRVKEDEDRFERIANLTNSLRNNDVRICFGLTLVLECIASFVIVMIIIHFSWQLQSSYKTKDGCMLF